MNRIVVVGNGPVAHKTCSYLRTLDSSVDIVWAAPYCEQKYPWWLAHQLLSSGCSAGEWSRLRAKLAIDFEKRSKQLAVQKELTRKIKINARDRQITILTNAGETTYEFEALLVFPPLIAEDAGLSGLNFPSSECMKKIEESVKNPQKTLVVGNSLSLVFSCVHLGDSLQWLRPRSGVWDPEILAFVDRMLNGRGIEIIDYNSDPADQIKSLAEEASCILQSSRLQADLEWIRNLGIRISELDTCGISFLLSDAGLAPDEYNFQTWTAAGKIIAEQGLTSKKFFTCRLPSGPGCTFFGEDSLFRTGKTETALTDEGLQFDLALYTNRQAGENKFSDFGIKIYAARDDGRILGFQGIGPKAAEWGNLVEQYIQNKKQIFDLVLESSFFYPGPEMHPLQKGASIIIHKQKVSGILNITGQELLASVDNGAEFFLLDVRDSSECGKGMLSGAYNIPLNEIKKRFQEIPKFTPLVIYSRVSGRAFDAAVFLRFKGARQLYVLDGGYEMWPFETR